MKKAYSEYKNEAGIFLIALLGFLMRIPQKDSVTQLLYGQGVLSSAVCDIGILSAMHSLSADAVYIIDIVLSVLYVLVILLFACRTVNTLSGKEKERAVYICCVLFVAPASVMSGCAKSHFGLITDLSFLLIGMSLFLSGRKVLSFLIPLTAGISAAVNPVCACFALPLSIFLLYYETKKDRKNKALYTASLILCMAELAICTVILISRVIKFYNFDLQRLKTGIVSVVFCIPVLLPVYAIWFKAYKKGESFYRLPMLLPLFSIPVFLSGANGAAGIISAVSSQFLLLLYFLYRKDYSVTGATDKLFGFFKEHMFLMCAYLFYCCVITFSSMYVTNGFFGKILSFLVL